MQRLILICYLFFSFMSLPGQIPEKEKAWLGELKGGIRIQKTQKLYWENGFALDYASPGILDRRIHFGVSYVTTRLGSAMGSNAIKQDNYLLSLGYYFRNQKKLQPFTKVNMGYFYADYEYAIFDVLTNDAFLFSIDAGLSYELKVPITINLCGGYNFNYGTGIAGPGTLYPFFYQMNVYYTLFKKK